MSSLLSLERKQNDFLRRKNHTLWGGTYVDVLYTGVPPPPRRSSLLDNEITDPVVLIGQLIGGIDFPWFVKNAAKY